MSGGLHPMKPRSAVEEIVENTRAIRWWIDTKIEEGLSDDQIVTLLPCAVAFITGKMSESELLALVAERREGHA